MNTIDGVLLLLGAGVLLVVLGARIAVPYPSILVMGGLALASIPGAPGLSLDPATVLSVFLPAVIFEEASHVSWRDLRSRALLIGLLAPSLVAVTCAAVAVVAILLFPGIPVPVAIVIGMVIAPADGVASRAVLARLHVPRRVVTVLVGEGLVTDTLAVLGYKLAVAGVLGAYVSVAAAFGELARLGAGGILFGVAAGWLGTRLLRAAGEHLTFSVTSLTLAFATYSGAEALGLSGALATAAAGLMYSRHTITLPAALRFNARVVWQVVIFALNALGFVLVGVQLPRVFADLRFYSAGPLIGYAAAVTATILLVRLAMVVAVARLARPRRPSARTRFSWRDQLIVGWSGMRGLITLAAALGLPPTPEGSVFPYRDLTLFLAFAAIISTLLGQGLTLSPVVSLLRDRDWGVDEEMRAARIAAAEAALALLDSGGAAASPADAASLRNAYGERLERLHPVAAVSREPGLAAAGASARRLLIQAERRTLLDLHRRQALHDDALHELLNELDAAELALQPHHHAAGPAGRP